MRTMALVSVVCVSLVLLGCPTDPSPTLVSVPDLEGLSLTEAFVQLDAAALAIGTITEGHCDTQPAGLIFAQAPVAAASVAKGSPIALTLSLGAAPVMVPDLAGLTPAEALAALDAAGLATGTVTEAYSTTVTVGLVLSQTPAAGTSVAAGSMVQYGVSLGPEPLDVPELRGLEEAAAVTALTAAGFTAGAVSHAHHPSASAGLVIAQVPDAGVQAMAGSAVALTLSLGPAPVAVPELAGLSQVAATAQLQAVGFVAGTVSQVYSDSVVAGQITEQSPVAGALAVPGSAVDFAVSKGPAPVPVPDVTTLAQAEAEAALAAAGFVVGLVNQDSHASIPEGHVISQLPSAGGSAVPGTLVHLTVCSGEPQSLAPDLVGKTRAQAETLLAYLSLTLGTVAEAYHATVPAGSIYAQDPAPQTLLAHGASVAVTISKGPEPVAVPAVTGLLQAAAATALAEAGFVAGTVTEVYHETIAAGTVLEQDPVAGTLRVPGSGVDLTLSKGRAPYPITMPDMVGLAEAAALTVLAEAELELGNRFESYSATVPEGHVIYHTPVAGMVVMTRSSVNLVISLGVQPVPVPDMVGAPVAVAQSLLATAGLVLGEVTHVYSETVPVNQVMTQSIAAGTMVLPGTVLHLSVSRGDAPHPVPDVVGLVRYQAESALRAATFTVGGVTHAYSNNVPEGYVISQAPVAGSEHDLGTPVALVVSLGAQAIGISTIEELQKIGNDPDYPLDGHYVLLNDIDATATRTWNLGDHDFNPDTPDEYMGFEPIAWIEADPRPLWAFSLIEFEHDMPHSFTGVLDGQGHAINGLYINRPVYRVGLFISTVDAQVHDLGLENVDITGIGGALSYYAKRSAVYRCYSNGTLEVDMQLIARFYDSSQKGTSKLVDGADEYYRMSLSGLVGVLSNSVIYRSFSTCDINVYQYTEVHTPLEIGGLVGTSNFSVIKQCYAEGDLDSPARYIGGLVGIMESTNISQCYARGDLLQPGDPGGFVCDDYEEGKESISESYSTGNTPVDYTVYHGGFVAFRGPELFSCFVDEDTSGLRVGADQIDSLFGCSTVEMQTLSTYTSELADQDREPWDFTHVWSLEQGTGYPVFDFSPPAAFFTEGSGMIGDPYIIRSIHQLQAIDHAPWAHFRLGNDISAAETQNWHGGLGFKPLLLIGSLDGAGHTISNLHINRDREVLNGLFRILGPRARVDHLTIEAASIHRGDERYLQGGLCAVNNGTVSRCDWLDPVKTTHLPFMVLNNGVVEDCMMREEIERYLHCRTFIMKNNGVIDGCESHSTSTRDLDGPYHLYHYLGFPSGLVGENIGEIRYSQATTVYNNFDSLKRLSGIATYNYGTIEHCYADVRLESNINLYDPGYVQAFNGVALYNIGTIDNTHAQVHMFLKSFDRTINGFVMDNTGVIRNSSSSGELRVHNDDYNFRSTNGFIYRNAKTGIIERCFSDCAIISTSDPSDTHYNFSGFVYSKGGFVGINQGLIQQCYALGDVSEPLGNVGGFAGYNIGQIQDCFSKGNVHLTGTDQIGGKAFNAAGGFVGVNNGYDTINRCYALGNVTSSPAVLPVVNDFIQYAGGFMGLFIGADDPDDPPAIISQCYAVNSVNATGVDTAYAGGFVGGCTGELILSECYAATPVSATGPVVHRGAMVGHNAGPLTLENSFWNSDLAGALPVIGLDETAAATVNHVFGLPSADLELQATYTSWLAAQGGTPWDLVTTWIMTTPATRQAPYEYITLRTSGNPNLVQLPDLTGLDLEAILALLESLGLREGRITYVEDDSVLLGTVLWQSVAPGSVLWVGDSVDLQVTANLTPFTVPDVMGLPREDAEAILLAAGMLPGRVDYDYNPDIPMHQVIDQVPLQGSTVTADTRFHLTLSGGKSYWKRLTNYDYTAEAVCATHDGGYVMLGGRYQQENEYQAVSLVKVDADGNELWKQGYFNGHQFNDAQDIKLTPDNGFIVVVGKEHIALLKTDAMGNEEWVKQFTTNVDDRYKNILLLPDGGYLLYIEHNVVNSNPDKGKMIKLNAQGGVEWSRFVTAGRIDLAADGGYVILSNRGYADGEKANLEHLDEAGNTLWAKEYDWGGLSHEYYDLHALSDGGYLILGIPWTGSERASVMKVDEAGNRLWRSDIFRVGIDHRPLRVRTLADGYLVAFNHHSLFAESSAIAVCKLSFFGELLWEQDYLGTMTDMIIGPDGNPVICGNDSYLSQDPIDDVFDGTQLRKLDTDGTVLWEQTYGQPYPISKNFDSELSRENLVLNADGSIVFSSFRESRFSDSLPVRYEEVLIAKIDIAGNLVWYSTLGDDFSITDISLLQSTSDGGYLLGGLVGYVYNGMEFERNSGRYLAKLDADGNVEWKGHYRHNADTLGTKAGEHYDYYRNGLLVVHYKRMDAVETEDGGYLVAGYDYNRDPIPHRFNPHYNVYKLDADGTKVWSYSLPLPIDCEDTHWMCYTGGGYSLHISSQHPDIIPGAVTMFTLDGAGNRIGDRELAAFNRVHYVKEASGNNTIIAGVDIDEVAGLHTAVVIKIDANGDQLWQYVQEAQEETQIARIEVFDDDRCAFLVLGENRAPQAIVKLHPDGTVHWTEPLDLTSEDYVWITKTPAGGISYVINLASDESDNTENENQIFVSLDRDGNELKRHTRSRSWYTWDIISTVDGGYFTRFNSGTEIVKHDTDFRCPEYDRIWEQEHDDSLWLFY